jgi:small-conductance mechanosensitive channel
VVGGTLAFGVAFGSRNVVSNFISGFILLAERPLKLGDLVEVDNTDGIIEQIALRSTRVRSGDTVHIIVPNPAFLENRVIDWTHNDPNVRVWINVGVAWSSPTRDVERLIRQALAEHPGVLKSPEPMVLFKDVGDNALVFDAAFRLRMRKIIYRLHVESDVQFRINDLFNEAGSVIAFPQRDVHLDSLRPVEVRLVDGREQPPEA